MIQVPRRGPGVIPTAPLPNFRHTADEFAPPNPIDLAPVTRELAGVFERERQKANQVAILDADNQLSETQIELQSEAFKRQGKDALEALPKTAEQWKERASAIESSLSNDDQKLAFRRLATGRWESLHETVARHTDSEMQKYDASTTDAAIQNRLNEALANYTDPAAVGSAVAETRAIITDFGRRHGVGSDVLKQQTAAAVSRVHAGVIDRMLANGNDLAASNYYKAAKPEVTGADAVQLEKALEEGSLRGESQRQADAIVAAAPSRSAALEEVRKITDPKVRDATENRVNQFFSEKSQADRETGEANMLNATNIVDKTGSVYQIPPALWTTFTVGERAQLKEYAKQRAKGEPVATDWATYYDLESLASSDATRDRFLRTNLLGYRARLGDTEFKQLVDLQASLRRGDEKAAATLGGIRTTQQVVSDGLAAVGIDPTPKPGSDDAERGALFRRQVDQAAAQLEAQTNKKPTATDMQGIVDNLLVKGVTSAGGFFGWLGFHKDVRQFERGGDEDFVLDVTDVPAGERAKIEQALRGAGQPVTDANVLRLYQRKLATMVPRGR